MKNEFLEVFKLIDPEKNKHIILDTLTSHSRKIVYLRCDNPKHNWHARVHDLTRKRKNRSHFVHYGVCSKTKLFLEQTFH